MLGKYLGFCCCWADGTGQAAAVAGAAGIGAVLAVAANGLGEVDGDRVAVTTELAVVESLSVAHVDPRETLNRS
jgi:hypothetical protein